MVNFKSVKMDTTRQILKGVTDADAYKWTVKRMNDGLFITNDYFTNNERVTEGYTIRESEDDFIQVALEYTADGVVTYKSIVIGYILGDDRFSNYKEYNFELLWSIARSCLYHFNHYV